MSQLPLFNPDALARFDDPDTSKAAAASIGESRARQHRMILRCMKRHFPFPMTPEQISDEIGVDIWRRMSELRDAGLVARTNIKKSNRSGRLAYCYILTLKGDRYAHVPDA